MNPHKILSAALSRALRPGEVQALTIYLSELERKVEAFTRDRDSDLLARDHVEVRLHNNTLYAKFPGQHSVKLPSGLTQHDRALAMDLLVRILADRQGQPCRIAQPGAPTQHELQALARAIKPKKLPPKKKHPATEVELSTILANLTL